MKRTILCLAVLLAMGLAMEIVLVGHAATSHPNSFSPDQVKPPGVKVPHKIYSFRDKNALAKFLQQPSPYTAKIAIQTGLGVSNADLSTLETWVAAINDGRDPGDFADAGFYSVALENTSGVKSMTPRQAAGHQERGFKASCAGPCSSSR
jgi:hypothetical protein